MARKKKRKKHVKNKILKYSIIIGIVSLVIYKGYYFYKSLTLDTMDIKANINDYYIYGTHFNMEGTLNEIRYDKFDLVLFNGKFKSYKLNIEENDKSIKFTLSDKINDGIFLENIKPGKYYMFIRGCTNKTCNYYKLKNKTSYDNTKYYTLSNKRRKIVINSENKYQTMSFNVTKYYKDDTYDIVLDPGHGSLDGGSLSYDQKYNESDLVMDISKTIEQILNKRGIKTKLTRNENDKHITEAYNFSNSEAIGRAILPKKVNSKYVFSIHLNSIEDESVNGIEVYLANNMDYLLANTIVKNVRKKTDIKVSTKYDGKVKNGIYVRNFTQEELTGENETLDVDYDIQENTNYLFMIREPGCKITGAYVDKRNKDTIGYNPYYKSNVGVEAYLLELGYITNAEDLKYIVDNKDEYAKVIADSIYDYLN